MEHAPPPMVGHLFQKLDIDHIRFDTAGWRFLNILIRSLNKFIRILNTLCSTIKCSGLILISFDDLTNILGLSNTYC